jgi:hypothetical protein
MGSTAPHSGRQFDNRLQARPSLGPAVKRVDDARLLAQDNGASDLPDNVPRRGSGGERQDSRGGRLASETEMDSPLVHAPIEPRACIGGPLNRLPHGRAAYVGTRTSGYFRWRQRA